MSRCAQQKNVAYDKVAYESFFIKLYLLITKWLMKQ